MRNLLIGFMLGVSLATWGSVGAFHTDLPGPNPFDHDINAEVQRHRLQELERLGREHNQHRSSPC